MKMSKNYKKICLTLGLTGIIGAGSIVAASGTTNVSATYRNIQVTYNGVTQSMAKEPFLVDGSVYVPLRAVGDIFGATPVWQPGSNTVAITGGSSASSQDEITNLNYQIAALKTEIANKDKEISDKNTELANLKASQNTTTNNNTTNNTNTSGSNITAAQLQSTEDYLNQTFYDALSSSINTYYDLTLTGSQINVTISYDNRAENTAFDKISQSKVEAFLKKIGDNIAATHSDVTVEGTIEYTKDSVDKATFTRAKNGRYTYNHSFDADTIKDELQYDYGTNFRFSNLAASSVYCDYEIDVRENRSTINVKVYLSKDESFRKEWGTADSISTKTETRLTETQRRSAVTNALEDIQDIVMDIAADYDVNVSVYFGTSDLIAEINADGRVSVSDIDA